MVDPSLKVSDVRFFWTEGDLVDDRWYHWCLDCPWVSVGLWHGGGLVNSRTPPPEAQDESRVREFLLGHHPGPAWSPDRVEPSSRQGSQRWLCRVCKDVTPRSVAIPRPAAEGSCRQCGCPRQLHAYKSVFNHGCGMAWADGLRDNDNEIVQVGMIHCPCDGYVPPWVAAETPSMELV